MTPLVTLFFLLGPWPYHHITGYCVTTTPLFGPTGAVETGGRVSLLQAVRPHWPPHSSRWQEKETGRKLSKAIFDLTPNLKYVKSKSSLT